MLVGNVDAYLLIWYDAEGTLPGGDSSGERANKFYGLKLSPLGINVIVLTHTPLGNDIAAREMATFCY